MRHNSDVRSFNRPFNQRKALIRGLVVNFVEHERIKTTIAKAKELRRVAERSVTLAKRGDLNSRRLLLSRLANQETVAKLVDVLGPRFKDRNGGYTRIYRLNPRAGDNAPMALIEFIGAEVKSVEEKRNEEKKRSAAGKKGTGKRAAAGRQAAGEKKAKSEKPAKAEKKAKKADK